MIYEPHPLNDASRPRDADADAFEGTTAELIQTNLSDEQEQTLREAFADELQEQQA